MTPEINKIYTGDCRMVMTQWPENFIDTIVTDPPYGLSFMGKDWDHGIPGVHFWAEALRIAKPGALLLAFGGTRTFHRLAVAIEDAGWQIRDCLMWLYGSGFPKSHNLHGQFEGWGTALKPAWEPIIVAMKPIDGTFAENAEKWGVAGINVDGGRIEIADEIPTYRTHSSQSRNIAFGGGTANGDHPDSVRHNSKGRWPANLILDQEAAGMLDKHSEGKIHGAGFQRPDLPGGSYDGSTGIGMGIGIGRKGFRVGDNGGASRFFYVAKADRSERNEGCEEMPDRLGGGLNATVHGDSRTGNVTVQKNNHPTVKPLSLMKYLCNLTKTPTGGLVLDPFCGSGTTLWAAEFHNRPWIGIEMNPEYVAIANARIARERAQIKMAI